MYGAIIGDICGSTYEFKNFKTSNPSEIPLTSQNSDFTDDTVLTCAVMEALLRNRNYKKEVYRWANKYPKRSYGTNFSIWFTSFFPKPYNSLGNGSAMRVSPIGWALNNLKETLEEAKRSAEITHNHPEGIKGAQAVAAAIYLARTGESKDLIKNYLSDIFNYNLNRSLENIRPNYKFDDTCPGSVPEAIIAFLESSDFTSAIQNAISLGGDADTLACIAGSIAEAYYKEIPKELIEFANSKLPKEMFDLLIRFYKYTENRFSFLRAH